MPSLTFGKKMMRRIAVIAALTLTLLGASIWFIWIPYLQRDFEVKLARADIHYLIIGIAMFRKDFGYYPKNLQELVSREILTHSDLHLMTSRAEVTYLPPATRELDPERILIKGAIHDQTIIAKENLVITTTRSHE